MIARNNVLTVLIEKITDFDIAERYYRGLEIDFSNL